MRQMPLALAAMLCTTVPAAAQVRGIPVYNSGVATGLAIGAEVGIPNNASGGGTAFGGSVRLGLGRIGMTAMAVESNPGGTGANFFSVGGSLNMKLLGGPLIPLSVTLQGGAGYSTNTLVAEPIGSTGNRTELRLPVGLGIALSLPNPVLAIRPWLAPRLDVVHVSAQGATNTTTAFGISGGIEFNLLNGLGLHTGYDWSRRDGISYGTFGAGLHYALRVPGL